ncbi:MAG: threonylcarbamoyl-AMP synthase [Bacteroidales bacterium]|nr:threonylcarbamoyl-AMP synthase [Bacteroidales bacterium]
MDCTEIVKRALEVLKEGGVILYPTDTVWGIGCDATNEEAVRKVFEIKKRADSKSLVLLASDLDMVARFVREIPSIAIDLVEVNDRPMTIIYPQGQMLAPSTMAQDGSVGIRIPMSDFCRELVRKLRKPLVSTSANISGEPTPENFAGIPDKIKSAVDYIVPGELESESTGRPSQILKVGLKGEIEIIRA